MLSIIVLADQQSFEKYLIKFKDGLNTKDSILIFTRTTSSNHWNNVRSAEMVPYVHINRNTE